MPTDAPHADSANTSAARDERPDLSLAYVLATASFCAYAVDHWGAGGESVKTRVLECLRSAAQSDAKLSDLNIDEGDVEAYVEPGAEANAYLLINGRRDIILAFRGTVLPPVRPETVLSNITAAVSNAEAFVKGLGAFASDWGNNARAPLVDGRHQGFAGSWTALRRNLDDPTLSRFPALVDAARRSGGDQRLLITGHSKGGALATIAALDLPRDVGGAIEVCAYTFEAPRSLSQQAASAADFNLWRFEYENDVVPKIPPPGMDYAHAGRLARVDKDRRLEFFVPPDQRAAGGGLPGAVSDLVHDLTDIPMAIEDHFSIFCDVQQASRGFVAGEPIAQDWTDSFFARGLPVDSARKIAPGFAQWREAVEKILGIGSVYKTWVAVKKWIGFR